jgi:hypothetical protein
VQLSETDRRRYLQLPEALPRLRALAIDITKSVEDPYDKIFAIEEWLAENTTYSLDPPAAKAGSDPTEQFLFSDRRGFCVQIASSMVLMLRAAGVPSRVGVGYAPAEYDSPTKTTTVRARDAHAWAEVYSPDFGWEVFDPTAGVDLSTIDGGATDNTSQLSDLTIVVMLMVALVAAVSWQLVARYRRPTESWAGLLLRRLEREGTSRGRPRLPCETPVAYAEALRNGVWRSDDLAFVASTISVETYAPNSADPDARPVAEMLLDRAMACE